MLLGCTMAEAKDRVSVSEYKVRLAYRKKYGPLNPVRVYDSGPAMVASQINRAFGGKANPVDFMIWAEKPEEAEQNPDDIVKLLMVDSRVKKGRS